MNIKSAPKASRTLLIQRAQAILQHRYRLRSDQKVLVVYDGPKERIGKAFVQAARRIGAKVDVFRLRKNRFSAQTQNSLAQKISAGNYDLFVNMVKGYGEEAQERYILMKRQMDAQQEKGGALAHGPAFEEHMLLFNVNYQQMEGTTNRVKRALENADEAKVSTKLGTDLQFSIRDREVWDDAVAKKRDWTNFPCGEVFCAPIEDSSNGVLIADGSVGGSFIGLLPQPLQIEIEKGRIINLSWLNNRSANHDLLKKIKETLFQDEGASVLCELGIGVAPYPICGILLQDEKVEGHIHIAFGLNEFFGGKNKSKSHVDFLIRNPQLEISYIDDKSSRILTREGKLLV